MVACEVAQPPVPQTPVRRMNGPLYGCHRDGSGRQKEKIKLEARQESHLRAGH